MTVYTALIWDTTGEDPPEVTLFERIDDAADRILYPYEDEDGGQRAVDLRRDLLSFKTVRLTKTQRACILRLTVCG